MVDTQQRFFNMEDLPRFSEEEAQKNCLLSI